MEDAPRSAGAGALTVAGRYATAVGIAVLVRHLIGEGGREDRNIQLLHRVALVIVDALPVALVRDRSRQRTREPFELDAPVNPACQEFWVQES